MKLAFNCAIAAILLSTATLHAAPPAAPEATDTLSLTRDMQVPGTILKPGAYTIHILDHLADRVVVRIDGQQSGTHATFIGLRNERLKKNSSSGAILWKSGIGGNAALRGFAFSNGSSLEFVYPKDEAVALAKENSSTVPAIDPASEGRAAEIQGLSQNDMEMVTLWMLSPTVASPGDPGPGIKAERYKFVASAKQKPLLSALPHTGSNMLLLWTLGILSLLGAGALRMRAVLSASRA
jgi:hypothetical protein